MQKKVFGIGFHKTATSSLGIALSMLGYRVCGAIGVRDDDIQSSVFSLIDGYVSDYDAFQDNPWPVCYEYLNTHYPDSLFILTVRDEQDWLASSVAHFGHKDTPMREWIYGVGHPEGNEALYLARYQQHQREVKNYFSTSPEKLLIMDITQGDGWPKLCKFLDKTLPEEKFPFENSRSSRRALIDNQPRPDNSNKHA
ncbi:MAG: hypothetical protein KUG75_13550, partial [Pseudomonadales bacterium]|nr:hypothetical protein [Pseudomonadales bacterium]